MRGAFVENNVVVNVISTSSPSDFGAVPCSNAVGPGWTYSNGEFAPPNVVAPGPPTADDVNMERSRRIKAGEIFLVSGAGLIPLTGRNEDKINLAALKATAKELQGAGVSDPVMTFRDANNVNHLLTPAQMIDLVDQGQAWIFAVMQRSWEMKDGTGAYTAGIPEDYYESHHWPVPAS